MENNTRKIIVNGTGRLTTSPDMLRLIFTISGSDKEYDGALASLSARTNALKKTLIALGFKAEELKTVNFDIYSQVKKQNAAPTFAYSHRLKLEFDVDMKKLSEILDALAKCMANAELDIEYDLKDPQAHKNEALKLAVKDAFAQAEIIAAASGVELGQVLEISHSSNYYDYAPFAMNRCMLAKGPAGSTVDIEANTVEFKTEVTATWSIM